MVAREDSSIISGRLCQRPNMDGNTALHEAVLNYHFLTAKYLYDKHHDAAFCLNKDNICPLFIAIKNYWSHTHHDLVQDMVRQLLLNQDIHYRFKDAKSVIHMAISLKTKDILQLIINSGPQLVESLFDSRGRSPLSYAAYIGYAEGVSLFLNRNPDLEFKRDNDMDGSFPIHYAAKGGHVNVMKLFKSSENLVNNNTNKNVLHLAAESGRLGVVVYLLKQAKFKKLLNAGDANGNTPLHLAVKGFHHQVVRCLLAHKNVDVNSINKELLTPRDILQRLPEYQLGVTNGYTFNVKVEIMVALLKKAKGETSNVKEKADDPKATDVIGTASKKGNAPNWEKAHILLVVATLMIGLSYEVIASLAEKSSVKGNGLFSISLFVTFYAAICASLFLLGAAMIERVSTNFLYLGAILIYTGLLSLTFSGMAAIYNIHNVPNTKWTALSIGLVVSALVCISLVLAFPFVTFRCYFRTNLATIFLPYCCACFGEKKDNTDDFGI